ncbi:MAG: hypothetical protein ACYDEP_11095 [Acidimicrobiales bacterium]|jgi:hypothetical protein
MEADEEAAVTTGGLDESASLLRYESSSVDAMLHALVERFSCVPGLDMTVTHRHGKLRKVFGDIPYVNDLKRHTDPISSIVIKVGSTEYWVKNVKGILRFGVDSATSASETVTTAGVDKSFSKWAESLISNLTSESKAHYEAISALRDLTERGRP